MGRDKRVSAIPLRARKVLAASTLVPGENAADYQLLFNGVTSALDPADVLEALWAKDVVDAEWDIQRLTQIQSEFLRNSPNRGYGLGIAEEQDAPSPGNSADDLAKSLAESYLKQSAELERVTRMLVLAEERRNRALREFGLYRKRKTNEPRLAKPVIEGEFQEITLRERTSDHRPKARIERT